MAKKARTYEWVIVTYGRFLLDRRAPRVTKATCTFCFRVHFNRNRKRAKPCKKGRESLIWFCTHFQFQERVLFAPFWSSKCSNRPCSGFLALQGSLKCHGIAEKTTTMAVVQLPKSLENRSTTTPLVGIPGRLCLRWTSRNVFFVTQRKKEKLLKPRGTYPLYLGVFPNDSAQYCSKMSLCTRLFTPIVPRRSLHISFY